MATEEKQDFVLWFHLHDRPVRQYLKADNIDDAKTEALDHLKLMRWVPEGNSTPYIAQLFDLDVSSFQE